MVRIVGILCGSALAISFLIIALGVPEFLPKPEDIPEAVAEAFEVEARPAPAPLHETVLETVVEGSPEPVPEVVEEDPEVSNSEEALPQASEEYWYAFWSPFRSELAANGFVSQLQRTTGMDYRVVQLKPGVYEVAFAYEAETDIENKLAAISAATGLEMPDG
jgi:hypothetical protein